MTGAPAANYTHDADTKKSEKGTFKKRKATPDELWEKFTRAERLGRYLIGNGRAEAEFEGKDLMGILPQHAYPIIKLVEFQENGE